MLIHVPQKHILAPEVGLARVDWNSPQAQGLVGFWPLNEGGGTVARDLAERNNGSIVNGAKYTPYRFGRYLNFTDTSSQYVTTSGTSSLINGATRLTVSGWFKRSASNATVNVMSRIDLNNGIFLGFFTDKVYAIVRNASTGNSANLVLNNLGMHHLVMVFDGSQSTNATKVKLYVNGILRTDATYAGTMPTSIATTSNFEIGRDTTTSTTYSNGLIGDVRIYNRALSYAEVKELHANPLGIYVPRKLQFFIPETVTTTTPRRMLMGVGL